MRTKQAPKLPVVTWYCPRCPWYRDLSIDRELQAKVIDHPEYGRVSCYNAYRYDILRHSCFMTAYVRKQHGIPFSQKRMLPYQPRRDNAA